jgi:hypothetical protein
MADRTLSAKVAGALIDGPNLVTAAADGLRALSPAASGLTVQPGSLLAGITLPNARSGGFGGLPMPNALGTATATSTPPTTTVSGCIVTPFMVEAQKTISNIWFRVTAINGATTGTSAVLTFALHRYDVDFHSTALVKNFGFYTHTSVSTIGTVPNASGTVLTPGIIYCLLFNPTINGSLSGNVAAYATRSTTYPSGLPLISLNDPPAVSDWADRAWPLAWNISPSTTDPASAAIALTGAGGVSSPQYFIGFTT